MESTSQWRRSPASPAEAEFLQIITATELNLPIEAEFALGNNVSIRFILIPAGEFLMGSSNKEKQRQPDEGPVHQVTISRPFYMGKFEVTQLQYNTVMGVQKECKFRGDGFPVENINWYEVNAFISGLSHKFSLKFRLPTEAEWEYACRAGTDTPFYTGQTISALQANYNSQFVYGKGDKGVYLKMTTQVGNYPPNAFGLYDMHGNVAEWCSDWYDKEYYKRSETINPKGPVNKKGHVIRGGSYKNKPEDIRSASRKGKMCGADKKYLGFRVVLEIPENGTINFSPPTIDATQIAPVRTFTPIKHELVYDEKSKTGHISITGRGLEARPWMMKKIGEICSSKNIVIQEGKQPEPGYFRVLDEKLQDGTYTIEFEAIR
ncbi:MAG: formylglycine-generating enzyme family protein [Sedimentisphaerales bacterium]|nr:formylglycine-generating enzyme family protein [Sedimentisphaerales bacterium]